MNIIFTLLLPLIPAAFPFMQLSAQVGQSKENLSVSINDLRNAPTKVVLDGRSLSLSAYPWRDFMPSTLPAPDGSPMIVVLKVATSDKKPFPSGVRMDRVWVLFGEQVWETSELRAQVKSPPYDKDSWINCSDSTVCEATARDVNMSALRAENESLQRKTYVTNHCDSTLVPRDVSGSTRP